MSKTKRYTSVILIILSAFILSGCLDSIVRPESSVTSKVGGGMDELLPPYNGPRAFVAVDDFEWKVGSSKTTIGIGGTDFSFSHEDEVAHTDSLKAMLTTALVQSKRYRVLERARIDGLKDEIALQEDGYTDSSGKKRGSVKGTDLRVTAYITGWAPGSSGKSGGITGGILGKKASALLGAVSGGVKKSSMAMDIRIWNSETSEVYAATSVETEAKDVNFGGVLSALTGGSSMGGGLDTYSNTPMEKAIRASILEATRYIAENTPAEFMVN
ncbi:MAG: curli biogenesis system outer membrane secretion channel CsgG [Granulosicoccus sp.]|jgi:curli biogenesis system outer membrane secretion channel CsgG